LIAARHGQSARFDERVRHAAQAQEPVVAEDRLVALERVLAVRVPPMLAHAERLDDAPAIGNRDERRW
jgi:hypothetical protein